VLQVPHLNIAGVRGVTSLTGNNQPPLLLMVFPISGAENRLVDIEAASNNNLMV